MAERRDEACGVATDARGVQVLATGANDKKKRREASRSRDQLSSLEDRVARLEANFGCLGDGLESLRDNQRALEEHTLGEIDRLKVDTQACLDANHATNERIDRVEATIGEALANIQAQIDAIRSAMAKGKTVESSGSMRTIPFARIEVPKPKEFKGVRDAKEVDNFLWQMEQYFEGCDITEEATKVKTAPLFLADTAMLWWRRKHGEMEKGLCSIKTWEEFKRELKRQFYPQNIVYEARKKLRELRHTSSIPRYVQEFTTLTLQIPNMRDEDMLFHFVDGLQPWARQELQRRGVQTVDEAIVAAEALVEFQHGSSSAGESFKPKPKGGNGNGGGDFPHAKEDERERPVRDGHDKKPWVRQGDDATKAHKYAPKGGCYICKGPHAMRECPKLGSLHAMTITEGPTTTKGHDAAHNVDEGPRITWLGAMTRETASRDTSKGLLYVNATVNGRPTQVMVDTGATGNFMTEEEARRLGLKVTRDGSGHMLKTVNTVAKPIVGVVRDATLRLGEWKGRVNFTIAEMDDFNVVLGMDFMRKYLVAPIPHLNALYIMERETPCVVQATARTPETGRLSGMRVLAGVEGQHVGTLATVRELPTKHEEGGMPKRERDIAQGRAIKRDVRSRGDKGGIREPTPRTKHTTVRAKGKRSTKARKREELASLGKHIAALYDRVSNRLQGATKPKGGDTATRASPRWVGENVTHRTDGADETAHEAAEGMPNLPTELPTACQPCQHEATTKSLLEAF